jgi:hypothetical protein
MNSKKICQKCNTELSSETGECFYCKDEIKLANSNYGKSLTNTIFAFVFIILYLLVYYRLFFETFNGFINDFIPIFNTHLHILFLVSAGIFPIILIVFIFLILTAISQPKVIANLIQLAIISLAKIFAAIFLLLLGLSIIVFSIKFIKSQLFN